MMIMVMIKQAMLAKIKIEPCTAPSCLPEQILSILDDYGDDANDDQACSTCKDHNRTAAHYTKVSSRAIIRMIFHARRQETSLGVLVKGLCGTVRPDLGLAISNKDIQCIIHLRFVWTKIFLLIWALPSHIQNAPLVCLSKNVPPLL